MPLSNDALHALDRLDADASAGSDRTGRLAPTAAEPLPAMVYRSEAFAEDLDFWTPGERALTGAWRAGLARVWAMVPMGVALAAGIGLPWTLPH